MGNCRHCGMDAGFLRFAHPQCKANFDKAVHLIAMAVGEMGSAVEAVEDAVEKILDYARRGNLDVKQRTKAIARGWGICVDRALGGDGLDADEEASLNELLVSFNLSRTDIDRQGRWRLVEQQRRDGAKKVIHSQVAEMAHLAAQEGSQHDFEASKDKILEAANRAQLSIGELADQISKGIEEEIDRALDDDVLDEEEEQSLSKLLSTFDGAIDTFLPAKQMERIDKAKLIRRVMDGEDVADRRHEYEYLPFRLMKSESLLWVFDDVDYWEVQTQREFRGRSGGVSVRVTRGVYLRSGAFRGRPESTEQNVHVDTGQMGITTKHIYFSGSIQSFRIRHNRIVSIDPFEDGIGVMRDTARAKRETFIVDDPWFAYNLLNNISIE